LIDMKPATPEELAKYDARAMQYRALAAVLFAASHPTLLPDLQVRSTAGTYALECIETARRWEREKAGGL
jgi:hypothetical protein